MVMPGKTVAIELHGLTLKSMDTGCLSDVPDPSELLALEGETHKFYSTPHPPKGLWDVEDLQFLDKVACHAVLSLISIDPKNGCFEGRLRCHWSLRTINYADRTEPRIRVPNIRLPRLVSNIDESRLWRNIDKDTPSTIYWEGTTMISFSGYEIFEVQDFPYDRQVISLGMFDFIWQDSVDASTYEESMKVVEFTLKTTSMLPEWKTFFAYVTTMNKKTYSGGPSSTTKFAVVLRLERKSKYYIVQIFLVTWLITSASLFPLILNPYDLAADRMALYAGGLLTLVAFKYTISDALPSVPYLTFTDRFLLWQMVTLIVASFESAVAYWLIDHEIFEERNVSYFEDAVFLLLTLMWLAYYLHAAHGKERADWPEVLKGQDCNREKSYDDHEEI